MPLKGPRDAGFTLMEMMVALAISGIVVLTTASLIGTLFSFQKKFVKDISDEELRALLRPAIQCGMKCTEARWTVPPSIGQWNLSVECQDWYDSYTVTAINKKTKDSHVVFTMGGGDVCKARTKGCVAGCHNRGVLLERGNYYPTIEGVGSFFDDGEHEGTSFSCPKGMVLIGVDFAIHRSICEDPRAGTGGDLCRSERYLTQGRDSLFTVEISGRTPCKEYTQVNAFSAQLDGKLEIKFKKGFHPSPWDQFTIIVAPNITGNFRYEQGLVPAGDGTFRVSTQDGHVILWDFHPVETKDDAH